MEPAIRVLIADDSLVMRRVLEATLHAWQYEVVVAENGARAWDIFQHGDFPLVLTDWLMPEMDGLELIRRIRGRGTPHYVYVILLTAKSEKEDLVLAMDAGADDFLAKPFDQDELRVRVREGQRIINLQRTLAEQNRQLQETQAALVQSEKLASLGHLAAGLAHEINNPLSYVINNLAVLDRDMRSVLELVQAYRRGWIRRDDEAAAEVVRLEEACDLPWFQGNALRLIQGSLEGLGRVRDIVSSLRDFARLDEAELDEVDLNAALRSTLGVLHYELDAKQISLSAPLAEILKVVCRPAKIHHVFHNLLLNAIQASQSGGSVEVRTRPEGEEAVVEIQDHGCGMDESQLARIFEPFFTTKAVGRGPGLGLAICYGIVRGHGGRIEVDSHPGVGSTFRVRLPFRPHQTTESETS